MNTERIEIYSSKKKSFILLLISLVFVTLGIFFLFHADTFATGRIKSPALIKGIGTVSIFFFGAGTYMTIRQLIKDKLILVIDHAGINVNPEKSDSEPIGWKEIEGFSEIKIHSTKIIIIHVNNPDYWLNREKSKIRRKAMKFNFRSYGSPFSISAVSMRISHSDLMNLLTKKLGKHKIQG